MVWEHEDSTSLAVVSCMQYWNMCKSCVTMNMFLMGLICYIKYKYAPVYFVQKILWLNSREWLNIYIHFGVRLKHISSRCSDASNLVIDCHHPIWNYCFCIIWQVVFSIVYSYKPAHTNARWYFGIHKVLKILVLGILNSLKILL